VGFAIVLGVPMAFGSIVVPVLLWLWMARKCKAGRPWARIVSTVLFGLGTVATLLSLGTTTGFWALAGMIAGWLAGLGATILLWQRPSSWYFRPGPRY
jgi:protein-S-isoprenylcysteine O-methyltransferase Ste14